MRSARLQLLLLATLLEHSCQHTVTLCASGSCKPTDLRSLPALVHRPSAACNTPRRLLDRDGAELSTEAPDAADHVLLLLPRLPEVVCSLQSKLHKANGAESVSQLLAPAAHWCSQTVTARAMPWLSLPTSSSAVIPFDDLLLRVASLQFTQPDSGCGQLARVANQLLMKEQPLRLAEWWLVLGGGGGRMRTPVGLQMVQHADIPSQLALERHWPEVSHEEKRPAHGGDISTDSGIAAVLVRSRVLAMLRKSTEVVKVLSLRASMLRTCCGADKKGHHRVVVAGIVTGCWLLAYSQGGGCWHTHRVVAASIVTGWWLLAYSQGGLLQLLGLAIDQAPLNSWKRVQLIAELSRMCWSLSDGACWRKQGLAARTEGSIWAAAWVSRCITDGDSAAKCRQTVHHWGKEWASQGRRVEAFGLLNGSEAELGQQQDLVILAKLLRVDEAEEQGRSAEVEGVLRNAITEDGCRQQCLPGLINSLAAQSKIADAVELMGISYSNIPLAGSIVAQAANASQLPYSHDAGQVHRPPAVVEKVLPPSVLRKLQYAFRDDALLWHVHGYPGTGYFSYYFPFQRAARNALESAIINYLLPAAQAAGGVANSSFVGAEWWVHKRVFDGASQYVHGHPLHFDSDQTGEKRLSEVGSATFLSEHAIGGPTIFIPEDVRIDHVCTLFISDSAAAVPGPDEKHHAKEGWLVDPAPNRYVSWVGHYLHGVLPAPFSKADNGTAPKSRQRLTLLVAFWQYRSCTGPAAGVIGPCMRLPDNATWLHELGEPEASPQSEYQQGSRWRPQSVNPIWGSPDWQFHS